MTMQHPARRVSWLEEFLDGFTAVPLSQTMFSLTVPGKPKSFNEAIKFERPLVWDKKHPISVWYATAKGQYFIVKSFRPLSEDQIIQISRTYPEVPNNSTEQIRQDMDPFILEQRAYERIDKVSSKETRAFFPIYYGVCAERAFAIELLRPSLQSRCLCSNSVPSYFSKDLQLLREENINKNLSPLEVRWYESLFIDRLKRLTALHRIGITHGDIKEDHFRLQNDFHDTVLFDFSRAYTITTERPYMVQGYVIDSRYSKRWATWRSLQKLVELERNWLRDLINTRIKENAFRKRYGLDKEDSLFQSDCNRQELIVIQIYREPEELAFPSLASLLPFLEAASPNKSMAWVTARARALEEYEALWIRSCNQEFYLLATVAYSGESTCLWTHPTSSESKDGRYYLILVPKAWLIEGLQLSGEFVSSFLSTQSENRKAWTVDRTKIFVTAR